MKKYLLLTFIIASINLSLAQDSYVKDDTFNSFELPENQYYVDGSEITKSIVQPDGKIVLAVTSFSSVPTSTLIRMDYNLLDDSFSSATIDGIVHDMVLQTDGKIIIVGSFTTYGGQASKYIARLNSDGTIDNSFQVGTGFGTPPFSNNKFAANIKLQADGKILVGGDLKSYNGTPKNYLIRLNTDGTIDDSFTIDPDWDNRVTAFTLQPDGKIITSQVGHISRLNSDGSLDNSFAVSSFMGPAGIKVNTFSVQANGKILVGGAFDTALGANRKDLVRLNSDGTLDTTFDFSGFNAVSGNREGVKSILLKDNGQILVGGDFDYAYQEIYLSLLLLNSDGSIDDSFNGKLGYNPEESRNNTVNDLLQYPDGMVLCTGEFHVYNKIAVNNIVKFSAEVGEKDPTFHNICEGFDGGVQYLYQAPDGKIIATGDFYSYNGHTRYKIARLMPNGEIDESFKANTEAFIHDLYFLNDIAFQDDGKLLVASDGKLIFGPTGGIVDGGSLVRLNADGSLDSSFVNLEEGNYGLYGSCNSVIIEDNGKIIAAGNLSNFDGQPVEKIIRFNSDGTIDTSMDYEVPFTYIDLVQKTADNKLLVSGSNGSVNNRSLSRLNTNGQIDDTFQIDPNLVVTSFRILENGKILVTTDLPSGHTLTRLHPNGSTDTSFNFPEYSINYVAYQNAVAVQSSGKIIKSVPANINSTSIQRYNTDGTLDSNFSVGTGFGYGVGNFSQFNTSRLASLLVLEDGRFLAAGNYRTFDDVPERSLIRLKETNATYLDDITVDNDEGICGAVVNYDLTVFGTNAQVVQLTGLPSGSVFPVGLSFNSFEITVGSEIFTRTFYVTVEDAEAPVLNVTDIELDLNGGNSVSFDIADIDAGTSDNCGGFTMILSQDTFTQTGTYQVVVTATDNSNNVSETTIIVTVIDSTWGIGAQHKNTIELYPNPVKNVLHISNDGERTSIVIYDLLGRAVFRKLIKEQNASLNMSSLRNGIYLLKAETKQGVQVFRIIKE
ncbi:MAG TPA: T9SS type A sorting domain-containing protein [Flavobacteriaceae bacterium]|nr:T9SS type A sorting domain-containing protein [Flavobacteriaceae bacterium]